MPAEPHHETPDAMQGYIALIGAILQRALADSRLRIRHGTQGHTHPTCEGGEHDSCKIPDSHYERAKTHRAMSLSAR